MQIKVFTFPLQPSDEQTEEMNHFLRANKVVDVRKELALMDGNHMWTFCVTYIGGAKMQTLSNNGFQTPRQPKVDYREVLAPEIFERFSALRKLRKAIAEEEAVPAYAVFTDAELAEVAKLQSITEQSLRTVPGIGARKVEKYGAVLCNFDSQKEDEANWKSNG